ncbi:Hin recombinase [Corynebacterium sp. 320]|uniref:Hin recombinase n=1 Tax=Corynebacterium zhongnanshanii TaxID=2768834 RepID=A0ABQ6VC60_9CORY|nr:Hin recombinase [Corynebacterium sp. 320]KAB1550501.1 Hin recombinase [Corynebacterium sp. 319]KAB1554770.1 Hin recombinase [Corynebacterium sp. 321]KAB3519222.1 Hin recombinase [Corynebacterium zhongnanshanii]KAB3526423.1 Hin recombinase [Corynebacterium sp. 250]KAB3539742.1 Hin recombinase [Corynebacterium sp. 366]MCR5915076.1 helix-turn-helix domain-containing protein [Corynebacterium sp. zg254]
MAQRPSLSVSLFASARPRALPGLKSAGSVYKERAKALTAEQVDQAKRWIDEGMPKTKVAERLGVGRMTLYEYIKFGNP